MGRCVASAAHQAGDGAIAIPPSLKMRRATKLTSPTHLPPPLPPPPPPQSAPPTFTSPFLSTPSLPSYGRTLTFPCLCTPCAHNSVHVRRQTSTVTRTHIPLLSRALWPRAIARARASFEHYCYLSSLSLSSRVHHDTPPRRGNHAAQPAHQRCLGRERPGARGGLSGQSP